ncbi:hypothetical protein GCK32_003218 [Trichostrongylus colubriformis]|uniref:Uncharacterized protein n=1 Tax=Trichostrongylus colubriformis TaxID=6319 RepID=A0AAN8G4U1_TRICO
MMRELRAGDLRSGDKIDQIQVDWMTGRRRDPPPPSDDDQIARNRVTSDASDKPMIAGQLMIFELDEEPPEVEGRARSGRGPHSGSSTSSSSACAISKVGLFAVAGGLGAVCAALFIAVLTMFIKLSRTDDKRSESINYTKYADRFAAFRTRSRERT